MAEIILDAAVPHNAWTRVGVPCPGCRVPLILLVMITDPTMVRGAQATSPATNKERYGIPVHCPDCDSEIHDAVCFRVQVPPAPPPVACPACGAEHAEADERTWDFLADGGESEELHDVYRCPCGTVRLDGQWYVPMPEAEA